MTVTGILCLLKAALGVFRVSRMRQSFRRLMLSMGLAQKKKLWDDLVQLKCDIGNALWCVMGDFNEVGQNYERVGNTVDDVNRESVLFNSWIIDMDVIDLPFIGKSFTTYRAGGSCMSRLVRILLSGQWTDKWPEASQWAIPRSFYGHCPVLLKYKYVLVGHVPFKLVMFPSSSIIFGLIIWIFGCLSLMLGVIWRGMVGLHQKLVVISKDVLSIDLEGEESSLPQEKVALRQSLIVDWWKFLKMKNSLLFQKSKSRWLKQGDANTKFFHASIRSRRSRNQIHDLSFDGHWCEDVHVITDRVMGYFINQVSKSSVKRPRLDGVDFNVLSFDKQSRLCIEFSVAEVKRQSRVVLEIKVRVRMGVNSSFITLIPKILNPSMVQDFCPISLIGSLYKILANILALRLKDVMGSLISPSQLAFIQNMSNLDVVVVVNEVIHSANQNSEGCFLFKVDFEKAYDSVN
ncbi:PREDICTED: uncharacterized protein LOC109350578 [Lupinus angustifolius]|uniref:uncharacterized protein LOC109350578 n=1 Tax=Lupinus angustifolius TaxID=3871 RepID=UPI00092F8790|nr:PREDICTED: uncharacterized protein LOC109350578 [Lupinus angustifolius]